MTKRYIRHAAELVTCKGPAPKKGKDMADIGLIYDGGVLIHDDKIFAVGTTDELDKMVNMDEYEVIDASGKTVLPGFVDSHTHYIFGGYRANEFSWRLKGDTYMSIMERGGGINATVVPTKPTRPSTGTNVHVVPSLRKLLTATRPPRITSAIPAAM